MSEIMKNKNSLFFPNPSPQTKDMACPQAIEKRIINCSKKIKIKKFYHVVYYFVRKRKTDQ